VTLVATALCADRAMAFPRNVCPDSPCQTPRGFVGRITVSFRRAAPAVRIVQVRRDQERPLVLLTPPVVSAIVLPPPLSPFQFRLPPPLG
jgi:hypothetical protein